uniref:DHH family phosphoesterase n=1 Tax=Ignisphaera aggregans TaxID=334771 RepID=A0A7J2U108_9CREN
MVIKSVVLYHSDCDGVIAAGLYIRHFLLDYFPDKIMLKYSHPWRLHEDLDRVSKSLKEGVEVVVLLDLAISLNTVELLKKLSKIKDLTIVVVDHHSSSAPIINALKELGSKVKVFWNQVQSTPEVLASSLIRNLNEYEQVLVKVANICEGGHANDELIRDVSDRIKLVLAVEPSNESLIRGSVEAIVKGVEFWNSKVFNEKYSKAKWLLQTLLKRIEERIEKMCDWGIAVFNAAESVIYAGLFGIASTEFIKKYKMSIVLIREEEKKFVVTVRSVNGKALEFCKALSNEYREELSAIYGGHKEAASLTIRTNRSLTELTQIVKELIQKRYC